MNMPHIAIVRGKFLNRFEMQFFEPLISQYKMTAFGSLSPFHDHFAFPVVKLISPMDLPEFPYKMPLLNRLYTDAQYLYGLEHQLHGFDLVHTAETYYRYTQQCLDAKKHGIVKKVIATVLENIPFNNEGIRGRSAYKARARNELDHIIALTRKTKEALLSEGADPKKITVIPHFVDTKRFVPRAHMATREHRVKERIYTILFVGRLETYKGVYDVIDALGILEKDRALSKLRVRMVFVGDGSEKQRMSDHIKLNLKNWHSSIESATYDQMPNIYQTADIFVAPSKPRVVEKNGTAVTTWEEQYCTALLEAQACGLPIVTTFSGGIPENVGTAALLVPPGNFRALADQIKVLLLSSSTRRIYAKRARDRAVRVHDVLYGAQQLSAVYDAVLRK